MKTNRRKVPRTDLFEILNVAAMVLLMLVLLAPFWISLVGSLNQGLDYARGGVYLFPRKLTFANYAAAFFAPGLYQALLVTVGRTVIGTFTSVLFTMLVAYAMSRSNLRGRSVYMTIFLITMFFYGGIIPNYILYRQIGLLNNFLVYIIPSLFNVYYMVIFISFLRTIPEPMIEAARIDGANEYQIFWRMILPLSKPAIAAVALFVAVGHWNSYFDSLMFTTSPSLQTLQLFLYRIISSANTAAGVGSQAAQFIPQGAVRVSPETIKLAMMMITIGPIIVLYPFVQKYFIKGILIGSVKG